MKQQFYGIAFRKLIYSSVQELHIDVELWMTSYNTQIAIANYGPPSSLQETIDGTTAELTIHLPTPQREAEREDPNMGGPEEKRSHLRDAKGGLGTHGLMVGRIPLTGDGAS